MENQQKADLLKKFKEELPLNFFGLHEEEKDQLFEWFWKRLEENETEIQNLNQDISGYRSGHEINSKRYTEALSELNKKEELLKVADEVINKVAVGFTGYNDALEKYNSLKSKS